MNQRMNRWVYAIVGIITLLFIGLIYAWTVLQAPIAAQYPGWSKGAISLTFTLVMIFFCLGGFAGGLLAKKAPARTLLWISAVCLLAGFFLSSRAHSLPVLYLGFGVLSGFGSGLAYNAVLSTVGKWFPDKQGLISGLLLMGFGMSSFLMGKVYTAFAPSDGSDAWRSAFAVLGIAIFVVVVIASFFIVKPDESWQAPASDSRKKPQESYSELTPKEMLKTSSFWMFWIWAILLSAAGMIVMSQGTPIVLEACPGTEMSDVATIVGLISIFNGIGRIIFGMLFDVLGRFKEMLLGGIVFAAAIILVMMALQQHSMPLLALSFIVTGLGYGCITPTNSAFTSLFFGMKNYPVNYSLINMNLLVASFGSTIAGLIYDSTGSYHLVLIVTLVMIAAGTILSCLIRRPAA
ncbi:MAG: OFA family MFS transporter [Eubacterium sp.]|nr:OFA family MFS transporter [Eubacterium sp.]